MTTRETFEEQRDSSSLPSVSLHGSLLLQEVLRFNKPIKAVSSLLALGARDLRLLLSDPCGSRVADAFMDSPHVGEKSREALVKALKVSFGYSSVFLFSNELHHFPHSFVSWFCSCS